MKVFQGGLIAAHIVQVCGVYDAGELSVVKYGSSEVLGSCRVSQISTSVLSIQLCECATHTRGCMLVHLKGKRTIKVVDIVSGATQATIAHATSVEWLVRLLIGYPLLSLHVLSKFYLQAIADMHAVLLITGAECLMHTPAI